MTLYTTQTIELLDRRFNFLMQSRREDFMLDLADFLDFLLTHDRIKDFTMKIYYEFDKKQKEYNKLLMEEQKKVAALATKIRAQYPELDDSTQQPAAPKSPLPFEDTFAGFDRIVSGQEPKSFSLAPDPMTDDSIPRKLLRIIFTKFQEYEGSDAQGKPVRKLDPAIRVEPQNAANGRMCLTRSTRARCGTSTSS